MILAFLSSFSLTAMIILDRLLIKDCYGSNVKQALFVSVLATAILGFLSTMIYWFVGEIPLNVLFEVLTTWFRPYGILIVLAGLMSAQVLHHYFTCFSQNGDSTVVASWLAATPIFVYFGGYGLHLFGFLYEPLSFTPLMALAVILTSLSLALLELVSHDNGKINNTYRKHLLLMVIFNTAYILLIDQTFAHAMTQTQLELKTFVMGILPMYWIGFIAGLHFLFFKTGRLGLDRNTYFKKYILAILTVEILGMFVFFFEFLGLGELNSVTVSLIVGLHVIPVWVISYLLTKQGEHMAREGIETKSFLGVPLSQSTLKEFSVKSSSALLQLLLVLLTLSGIGLFLFIS